MTTESIAHNVYFEGKVQSLSVQTEKGKATVGVMKKGNYTFSASSPEEMIIITGVLNVKLDGAEFKAYHASDKFNVKAGSSFDVNCDDDVSYICYYG